MRIRIEWSEAMLASSIAPAELFAAWKRVWPLHGFAVHSHSVPQRLEWHSFHRAASESLLTSLMLLE